MLDFKINRFLTVKLENSQTIIYVNQEKFNHCIFLLIQIDPNNIESLELINSIDEAAERLDRALERKEQSDFEITPKMEFWAHCSNLQAWYENNYDTRLIHRNLAFPLLRKLTNAGDSLAKYVFKEEISRRFLSGYLNVSNYLLKQGYLEYLESEEIDDLIIEISHKFDEMKKSAKSSHFSLFLADFSHHLFLKKKNRSAINILQLSLELEPFNVENLNLLTKIYQKIGEHEKALIAALKVVEVDSDNFWGYYNLCLLYQKFGRYDDAIEVSIKALDINSTYKINIEDLINYLLREKKLQQAQEFAKMIIERNYYSFDYRALIIELIDYNHYDLAINLGCVILKKSQNFIPDFSFILEYFLSKNDDQSFSEAIKFSLDVLINENAILNYLSNLYIKKSINRRVLECLFEENNFDMKLIEEWNLVYLIQKEIKYPLPNLKNINEISLGYTLFNGHVTGLGFFKAQLDNIPYHLFSFNQLKDLNLSGNQFKSFPKSISQLKMLERLFFKGNIFKKVPKTIFNLKNLFYLDISNNSLKSKSKRSFRNENITIIQENFPKLKAESIMNVLSLEWQTIADIIFKLNIGTYSEVKSLNNKLEKLRINGWIDIKKENNLNWIKLV